MTWHFLSIRTPLSLYITENTSVDLMYINKGPARGRRAAKAQTTFTRFETTKAPRATGSPLLIQETPRRSGISRRPVCRAPPGPANIERPICGGSDASAVTLLPLSANALVVSQTPAGDSASLADISPGHAYAIHPYPPGAARFTDLRDYAVRLKRREGHGVRRCCEG